MINGYSIYLLNNIVIECLNNSTSLNHVFLIVRVSVLPTCFLLLNMLSVVAGILLFREASKVIVTYGKFGMQGEVVLVNHCNNCLIYVKYDHNLCKICNDCVVDV